MSHELRTPLNAIIGFASLLEMDSEKHLNPEQRENLRDIIQASNYLHELINEVLDLTMIESGEFKLSQDSIDLADLASTCINLVQPLAERFHVQVDYDRGRFSGNHLVADYTRTKQVLLNLMSNGIKYNRHDGNGTLHIECSHPEGRPLRMLVRDNGPGIRPEDRAKLFCPFIRLGAEGGNIEGTGIGLVIAKRIVERMGGAIGYESLPNGGSCFWFELPSTRAKETAASPPAAIRPREERARFDSRQKLLYIEDNPANLKLVQMMVEKYTNLTLLTANQPELGLATAQTERPSLILLDICMPKMDGYEALRHLRADPRTARIPVVAFSAHAMPEHLARAEEAGFDGYIFKPVSLAKLLEILHQRLIRRSHPPRRRAPPDRTPCPAHPGPLR